MVPECCRVAGMTVKDMARVVSLIADSGARIAMHHPWPRAVVTPDLWNTAVDQLARGQWTLLGLWGEADAVHMALIDGETGEIGVITLACSDGAFPSIGMRHPPAIRLERAIRDLFGHEALGLPDRRPWLDHGRWNVSHPLAARPSAAPGPLHYPFLTADGEGMHQIPVGPVHAGIIEPGHFRFTADGETVVRLEERLGYVHKGIESLMAGADLQRASKL